jgi:hypothetical protein
MAATRAKVEIAMYVFIKFSSAEEISRLSLISFRTMESETPNTARKS